MKRRDFLHAAAVAAFPLGRGSSFAEDASNKPRRVMSVDGAISANQLGKMLPHEHILVDFVCSERAELFKST